MKKILIVEDELIVAWDLSKTLERNGYEIAGMASSVDKALAMVQETRPWIVLVDIFLKGDLTGIDLAHHLNRLQIPFIYISANSNQQILEQVKTTRPYGFIVKPFREQDLLVTIDIALFRFKSDQELNIPNREQDTSKLLDAVRGTNEQLKKGKACEDVIGSSDAMIEVFKLIEQVASSETSVLLLGESGTGKEVIANCIVKQSGRRDKPFIKINCAAIPAQLMEAEFFGYEKGAFTGALNRQAGKFELAAGGTMLLDEIGEMPIDMQVKLLRVLQEKETQRIGSSVNIKTDVRIIAATSRNLEKEVSEGRFRLDLYYRLHVFPITLPPLRERKEDIALLVNHFIATWSRKSGKKIQNISTGVLHEMMSYEWPGNIRELEHTIERSVLMTQGQTITDIHLPVRGETFSINENIQVKTINENERDHIVAVLKRAKGRIKGPGGAAELLNIPPTTLHSKIKKLGITKSHVG